MPYSEDRPGLLSAAAGGPAWAGLNNPKYFLPPTQTQESSSCRNNSTAKIAASLASPLTGNVIMSICSANVIFAISVPDAGLMVVTQPGQSESAGPESLPAAGAGRLLRQPP